MRFGVFDHLDDSGLPLDETFASRLKIIEAYDRLGFHGYHLAEHHATPLGIASSPNLFLSAVAQRTRRLRFGALVYLLPFYHPVRLIEEIAMLDQLSGGRLMLGIGKGVSPPEMAVYGLDPEEAPRRYVEAFDLIRRGLSSEVLEFSGEFYQVPETPMRLRPKQLPHPPLWYGIGRPDLTVWAAAHDVNVVTLSSGAAARAITDRYRQEWARLGKPVTALPALGLSRHIVVAETDRAAEAIARSAYRRWRRSFLDLWERRGHALDWVRNINPPEFEGLASAGSGIAGSPATVRDYVARQFAETGASYLVGQFVFGDMPEDAALHSVELFAREVMPHFAAASAP